MTFLTKIFFFLRTFDCNFFRYLEVFFDEKILIFLVSISLLFVYIKKSLLQKDWFNLLKQFNIKNIIYDFYIKVKNTVVFYCFSSVFLSSIITFILKFIIGKSRPVLLEGMGKIVYNHFSTSWLYNSMPSGHASITSALFFTLSLFYPKYKYIFYTLIVIISLSRVVVGAHFITDVLVGILIGYISLLIIKRTQNE